MVQILTSNYTFSDLLLAEAARAEANGSHNVAAVLLHKALNADDVLHGSKERLKEQYLKADLFPVSEWRDEWEGMYSDDLFWADMSDIPDFNPHFMSQKKRNEQTLRRRNANRRRTMHLAGRDDDDV